MRGQLSMHGKTTAAAAIVAAGALTLAACGTRDLPNLNAQAVNGMPMSVACEPNQRAIVRPVTVNGAAMSQVECVSTGLAPAAAPVSYQAGMPVATPVSDGYAPPAAFTDPATENARVVPVNYAPVRTVAPQRLVRRAPVRYERSTRSVKKSALIIGGSAGAGAGIGAALGGKKGALIGALLGGGGATVWDQITRHKQ